MWPGNEFWSFNFQTILYKKDGTIMLHFDKLLFEKCISFSIKYGSYFF